MNATPASELSRLPWQAQGEYQVATDSTCLYIREGSGSVIAGFVFSAVSALTASWWGGWLLLTQTPVMTKAFGGFMLLVAAAFAYVIYSSVRRGRLMIVFDRGHPGVPGEIRYRGQCLSLERVRSLSTRQAGGRSSAAKSLVVAELHDGTHEVVGPCSVSTWPAHYAQQAATWIGIPFRHSTS